MLTNKKRAKMISPLIRPAKLLRSLSTDEGRSSSNADSEIEGVGRTGLELLLLLSSAVGKTKAGEEDLVSTDDSVAELGSVLVATIARALPWKILGPGWTGLDPG